MCQRRPPIIISKSHVEYKCVLVTGLFLCVARFECHESRTDFRVSSPKNGPELYLKS